MVSIRCRFYDSVFKFFLIVSYTLSSCLFRATFFIHRIASQKGLRGYFLDIVATNLFQKITKWLKKLYKKIKKYHFNNQQVSSELVRQLVFFFTLGRHGSSKRGTEVTKMTLTLAQNFDLIKSHMVFLWKYLVLFKEFSK